MKKIITIVFCMLASLTLASAESFNYLYSGYIVKGSETFIRLNTNPVFINFIEDNEAIRLVIEGESVMFYVSEITHISEYEMKITTLKKDGSIVVFTCIPGFIVFTIGDMGYIATDVPKYAW